MASDIVASPAIPPARPPDRKRTSRKRFDPSRAIVLPVGRPSAYTQEIADYIVSQIIGGRDLLDICDHDKCVPWRSTVYEWIGSIEEFRTRIAHAREALADHQAQKVGHLIETTTQANAQAARVKLMGLQWRAAKLNPKAYSDKSDAALNVTLNLAHLVESSLGELARPVEAKVIEQASPLPLEQEPAKRGK